MKLENLPRAIQLAKQLEDDEHLYERLRNEDYANVAILENFGNKTIICSSAELASDSAYQKAAGQYKKNVMDILEADCKRMRLEIETL